MVFWGAGKAIESLWSYLGPKAKEDAQPCFEYDGKSDGWLPVYLDGVQVMFRDSDKSTPDILWRADKTELVKMQSDIANHDGVHVRYTTEIDAAWPDVNKCVRGGKKVKQNTKVPGYSCQVRWDLSQRSCGLKPDNIGKISSKTKVFQAQGREDIIRTLK